MDNWKYLSMKSEKITCEVNLLIKKSRNTRDYIKKLDPVKENAYRIIQLIANDTYEFNNFQSITLLFQLISKTQEAKNIWKNIEKLMVAYGEEFNQDTQLYNILNKINNIIPENDNQTKLALQYMLKSFKKHGSHLPEDKRQEFVRLNDSVADLKDQINSCIFEESRISINDYPEIYNNKYLKTYIVQSDVPGDKQKYIRLNKRITDLILASDKLDKNIKTTIYKKYCGNIFVQLYEIIKIRHQIAKHLDFPSFSEMVNANCMNKYDFETIRSLVIGLDKTIEIELTNIAKEIPGTKNNTEVTVLSNSDIKKLESYDIKQLASKKKQELINQVGSFDLKMSVKTIISLFEKIYYLKFNKIKTDTKNENYTWSKDVQLYSVNELDGSKIGFIYVDLEFAEHKTCAPICVNLMKYANYPYGSDKYILPASAIIGSLRESVTYYDIVTIAHELAHCVHCLMGKNKICILNGIICENDFVEVPSILIEQLMWHENTIHELLKENKKNISNVKLIKKLNTIDIGLSLKNKCIVSFFDHFIHSSSQFIKICGNYSNDKVRLYDTFEQVYKNIVEQVMHNIEPCNKWTTIDTNVILALSQDNAGILSNVLISDILAHNLFTKCFDSTFFYKFRNVILDNNKMNTRQLLNSAFVYEVNINKNKSFVDNNLTEHNDSFSIDQNQIDDETDIESNYNSETNYFESKVVHAPVPDQANKVPNLKIDIQNNKKKSVFVSKKN